MPLQLSQLVRSLFLGIGTSITSCQSLGTSPLLHTSCTSTSSLFNISPGLQTAFTISGNMPEMVKAASSLSLPIAAAD